MTTLTATSVGAAQAADAFLLAMETVLIAWVLTESEDAHSDEDNHEACWDEARLAYIEEITREMRDGDMA